MVSQVLGILMQTVSSCDNPQALMLSFPPTQLHAFHMLMCPSLLTSPPIAQRSSVMYVAEAMGDANK